jgi:hypothetical protein
MDKTGAVAAAVVRNRRRGQDPPNADRDVAVLDRSASELNAFIASYDATVAQMMGSAPI